MRLITDKISDDELLKVINFFDENKQKNVCIEEMAELIQQLVKDIIGHKNKSKDKILEEFCDVLFMLQQMKLIYSFSDDEIENAHLQKFDKLTKYILNYNS